MQYSVNKVKQIVLFQLNGSDTILFIKDSLKYS